VSGGYPSGSNDPNAVLIEQISELRRHIAELSRPTGTSVASLVAQVQAALANIDATVQTAIAANSYTRAQIDSKVASPGDINPGTVSASGAVSGSTGTFNGGLNSTSVYSKNITGTRSATWTQNDGQMGTASSDENTKAEIVDSMLSSPERAQLILEQFQALHYQYKAEIAKRDDPTSPDYVGPEYNVHTELGSTAQRVHALGLWEVVVYDRELITKTVTDVAPDGSFVTEEVVVGDSLKVDEDGNPFPIGLHYELFGLVAIAAAQYLWARVKDHDERLAAIEGKLGL
jgi:hypothetical protein